MTPLVLALLACGGDDANDGTTSPSTETLELTFVTYNAGLARGFVSGADSRQPDIAAALAAVEADVVCLQEVWMADQVAAMEAATLEAFPHQSWPAAQQSSDALCEPGQLDTLLSCFCLLYTSDAADE